MRVCRETWRSPKDGSDVLMGFITIASESKWFTKLQGPQEGEALNGESCGVARQPGDREERSDAG